MQIAFDPEKRAKTLAERGLDFADAKRCLQTLVLPSQTSVQTTESSDL
jgi:uncharacterized DUF497 family protein